MNAAATTPSRLGRRTRGSVGFAAISLVMALTPARVASAAPSAVPTRPGYLALGDSIAFGYTPPQTTPPQNYFNAKNFVGYPDHVAAALDLPVANASCPGETTGSLMVVTAASNGCENFPGSSFGYRTVYPLHVKYLNSQLSYAIAYLVDHPMTKLVTINIGANDAGLCRVTTADHCAAPQEFQAMLHQLSQNLQIILANLRVAGHYRGNLVTLTYYSTDYADPVMTAQTKAMNAAMMGPTREWGGVLADGFTAFEQASAPFGGSPCAAGLIILLPDGTCDGHPTTAGHLLLAQAVEKALIDHSS